MPDVTSHNIGQITPARHEFGAQHHAPTIRTVLSEFCEAFEDELRPILDPTQEAAEALAAAPQSVAARRVLPSLRDLRHQIHALVEKVAEQQAYVLIFGPIKSGKSTFMNALSAAYVSEVTCLPAYPCMVYVSPSDKPGFVATHYDGRTAEFTQREALHEIVAHGHQQLTRRIREVEAEGDVFDPAEHMPDAIRRIDINIPIQDLEHSGAVLVDTPGLYSRMKFGYDRMTRDFRNAAACAIFIVKTDNLFLEQVFDEFNELLQLFSRIFLVVNLDSSKKDLLPDGTLAPSLEHENPRQIIEAFENLSMTAPLKEALDDGRLGIYPVDLLRAASRRVKSSADGNGSGNGSADEDQDADFRGQADFEALLRDLTQFLNSNEYLKAFLDDSLRRSRTLIDELRDAVQDDAVKALDRDVTELRKERDEAQMHTETIERLQQVQWRDHVQGLGPWLLDRVGRLARQVKADASEPIGAAVEQWFESPNSLHHLLEQELLPIFASAQTRLIRDAEDALKRRASEDLAGLSATEDLLADISSIGIDMRQTAEAALGGLKAGAAVSSPRPQLSSEQIPVRRSLPDWVLLRSGINVRQRLFGPSARPDTEIPPEIKTSRLGGPARETIHESAMSQLDALVDKVAHDLPDQLVQGYAERFERDLLGQLERAQSKAAARLADLERRLSDTRHAHESLEALASKIATLSPAVDELIERFGQTDPATLTERAAVH
ncbi:MAG: dynamin family protein [Gammaproteobacteria bacterium]|nr:dynamin family protein [Gammaproteobacteria bacterium]